MELVIYARIRQEEGSDIKLGVFGRLPTTAIEVSIDQGMATELRALCTDNSDPDTMEMEGDDLVTGDKAKLIFRRVITGTIECFLPPGDVRTQLFREGTDGLLADMDDLGI